MLALIARFVVDVDHLDVSDIEFLQQQIRTMQEHVAHLPADQKQECIIEWIEKHAENYRKEWQTKVISENVAQHRCPDCPLIHSGPSGHCEIHSQWAELLQQYLDEEISSRDYVEDTLQLLDEHKSDLKVTLLRKSRNRSDITRTPYE